MKSQVRTEIENILGQEFSTCYIDATNKAKTKYRMKLVTRTKPTQEQLKAIKRLPNVLDAKYYEALYRYMHGGIAIYFNCRPRQVDLTPVNPYMVTCCRCGFVGKLHCTKEEFKYIDLDNTVCMSCMSIAEREEIPEN